ncbi:hypothetical protein Lalb_Chr04g0247701 [Lupinus albus]|uniref:Uncharacterized protein n=1 Tax=Lupinus albus TaxID=3870 RepID=A0A6A4QL71_LUPAL|nr:hypothetical protein Lalb_Chr04g0247701 [Lupinus albus]
MCCPGKVCMCCTCLILVVIVIGMLFGFGVFKDGFHKIKDTGYIRNILSFIPLLLCINWGFVSFLGSIYKIC